VCGSMKQNDANFLRTLVPEYRPTRILFTAVQPVGSNSSTGPGTGTGTGTVTVYLASSSHSSHGKICDGLEVLGRGAALLSGKHVQKFVI
jgi:hypothetical protein